MKKLLYYDSLSEFNHSFYRDLLTEEHLLPQKIEINKMTLPDGSADDTYQFRGWELQKNNIRYLLSEYIKDKKVDIKEILPIMPKNLLEVGTKGIVYSHIKKPVRARIKPIQKLSFRELVDILSSFNHTNSDHFKLLWFKSLASYFFRYYDRTSTPAGFGKDSCVEVLSNLMGKCGTIESPTIAKLEERSTVLKWLAISEVVDISASDWRIIQQYLLAAGAHKPSITKHSRAHGKVGEVIDISDLSISLFYNDIESYDNYDKYFDYVSKAAVKDRFPAFRLHGTLQENFNDIVSMDIQRYVEENMERFKDIIHSLSFYKDNIQSHGYIINSTEKYPNRWKTSLGRLYKVIDYYCETQEEMDYWVSLIDKSIEDYKDMIKYPHKLTTFLLRLGIAQAEVEKLTSINKAIQYLAVRAHKNESFKRQLDYCIAIRDTDTYTGKNILLDNYQSQVVVEDSKNFW
jgi:hypothetical protein